MVRKVLLLVFLIILAPAAFPAINSDVDVSLQSQSPDPVEPGQIVKVKFKVESNGDETFDDVIVRLLPKHPFAIYGDKTEKNIGKLRGYATGADAVVVEFKLRIAEDAIEEEAELELEVLQNGAGIKYDNEEFLIDIQTHDAVMEVSSIVSDPEQIPPGETGTIQITVKNLADSLLKDVRLHLDFEDSSLPLAPHKSSSERRLAQLKSGFQDSLLFHVIADPDASPGLYKVPLNVSYNDEKGTAYKIDDTLAVIIGDAPKVRAFIKKSSALKSGSPGKITLSIANSGTTDIKFLELSILPSEDYELISTSDYFYIGDVDSDDTESEEINIYVNKKVEKLRFPVKLKYLDANNKPLQQQFDLEMNLYSSSQLKKFGIVESGNGLFYFFILVLITAGIIYYKYYYKKKSR